MDRLPEPKLRGSLALANDWTSWSCLSVITVVISMFVGWKKIVAEVGFELLICRYKTNFFITKCASLAQGTGYN